MLRDLIQEVRELGVQGTVFRVGWEAKLRTGLVRRLGSAPPSMSSLRVRSGDGVYGWSEQLLFASPGPVARTMEGLVTDTDRSVLLAAARRAATGRIVCFSRWTGDFGNPIDWRRNPVTNARWEADTDWLETRRGGQSVGDVKLSWEVARFPHAYLMSRAAALHPESADELASALAEQIEGFIGANAWGRGIHWSSGQEIAFRLMAWLFAFDVLLSRSAHASRMAEVIGDALLAGARHIERHLEYSQRAVFNNHLLSEALALLLMGALFPAKSGPGRRWRRRGWRILEEESERQFYRDGAYIQQSHNYHRVALQDLLWACLAARMLGERPAEVWMKALERSLDLLLAHQNATDGRLPNYGPNDGALPSPFTSCDFADFRPTLQAVSLLTRGERVYGPGPWDEEAAWMLGPRALDSPLRPAIRRSVSFTDTGYHVLRGRDVRSFGAFRCGSLRDRFSQIDMLHLDVWWRGMNVLVDGGSYLYNGPPEWHEHFFRTASHNTVTVDGRDQMLHHRRFKVLYSTKARLLAFQDSEAWAVVAGEHYGYARHPGRCVHRRAVLFVKDDLWVVADTVIGEGQHTARLHWLGGDFPHRHSAPVAPLELRTPKGTFSIACFDALGAPIEATVVRGGETPPRGWLSRYYAEKVPVPSYAAERAGPTPHVFISVLVADSATLAAGPDGYRVHTPGRTVRFALGDGLFTGVELECP